MKSVTVSDDFPWLLNSSSYLLIFFLSCSSSYHPVSNTRRSKGTQYNIHILSKKVIIISPTNEWVLSASTTLSSLLLTSSIRKRKQAELSHLPKVSHMPKDKIDII